MLDIWNNEAVIPAPNFKYQTSGGTYAHGNTGIVDAINDGLGEYYDWNGVSGITSTSAGTNATGDAGVVPYSNNDLYALSIGTVSLDDGTGNPDTTKTILAYTYLADATLSGTVTSADYQVWYNAAPVTASAPGSVRQRATSTAMAWSIARITRFGTTNTGPPSTNPGRDPWVWRGGSRRRRRAHVSPGAKHDGPFAGFRQVIIVNRFRRVLRFSPDTLYKE